MIKLRVFDKPNDIGRYAADKLANAIIEHPNDNHRIGTGDTPKLTGFYKRIRQLASRGAFNNFRGHLSPLDTYARLSSEDPASYTRYLKEELRGTGLFEKLILPNEGAKNPYKEARIWKRKLKGMTFGITNGGFGGEGHIAFAGPGESFRKGIGVKELSPETRETNVLPFEGGSSKLPTDTMSVSVSDFAKSREVVIQLARPERSTTLHDVLELPISVARSGSSLRTMKNVEILVLRTHLEHLNLTNETRAVFGLPPRPPGYAGKPLKKYQLQPRIAGEPRTITIATESVRWYRKLFRPHKYPASRPKPVRRPRK